MMNCFLDLNAHVKKKTSFQLFGLSDYVKVDISKPKGQVESRDS